MAVDRTTQRLLDDAGSSPERDDRLAQWLSPSRRMNVLIILAILLSIAGMYFDAWTHVQLDIHVYLLGARHLFDGTIYNVRIALRPHLLFTYTPFAGLFFFPLSVLPFVLAQRIWLAVTVAAFAGVLALSLWCVRPDLDRGRLWRFTVLLFPFLIWIEPIESNFHFGQINILLVLMVFADLMLVLRWGRVTLPRGVLVGVAAAIKLIPLVFVAYLFVTRQIRAALIASVTFVACTAMAAACNWHVTYLYWTRYALDAKRIGGVFYLSNQSLRGSLDRFFQVELSSSVAEVISGVVLIAGLALAVVAHRRSSVLLGVLVTGTTGLLVSPITWTHHMVWLIPVLAWLVFGVDRPRRGPWIALGATIVVVLSPMWFVSAIPHDEIHENLLESTVANSYFLLMLAFLVGVAVMLYRRSLVLAQHVAV